MGKRSGYVNKEKHEVPFILPLEKKSRIKQEITSHESDSEEKELELFLFGEKKEKLIETNFVKNTAVLSDNEGNSDLLEFTISTKPNESCLNDKFEV